MPFNSAYPGPFPSESPELSPGNLLDSIRLMIWYFFSPASLETYQKNWGIAPVRQLAAFPVSLLIWLPLAMPVLALDLGLFYGWDNTTVLALNAAIPIGFFLTGFLGRRSVRTGFGWVHLLGLLMLVVVVLLVIYNEFDIMVIAILELGWAAGGVIVGIYLLPIILATAIAWSLGVDIAAMVLLATGGLAGYYLPGNAGLETIDTRLYLVIIAIGAAVLFGPALGLAKMLQRFTSVVLRFPVLGLTMITNCLLFWVLIFDGWYVVQEIFA
jgi:hypothetical protein